MKNAVAPGDSERQFGRLCPAQTYGWPWPLPNEEILDRLVALHDERVEAEKRGLIRCLRPDYQNPQAAPTSEVSKPRPQKLSETSPVTTDGTRADGQEAWPPTVLDQIALLYAAVTAAL